MIYTVTLNPSLDYYMTLPTTHIEPFNRATNEVYVPGGKGINVSIVLNNLQLPTTALGFVGGFTGSYLNDLLKSYPLLDNQLTPIEQPTRLNVKVNGVTELNAAGPSITNDELNRFIQSFQTITNKDIVVLAGSGLKKHPHLHQQIAELVTSKGAKLIVDAAGDCLRSTLSYKPFLIKPNKDELSEFFDMNVEGDMNIVFYGMKLQRLGAKYVMVSLGKDGAILITPDTFYRAYAPSVDVSNAVGSGDSMVAGFIAQYIKSKNMKSAFRFAVASGTATAFSKGLATEEEILKMRSLVLIEE